MYDTLCSGIALILGMCGIFLGSFMSPMPVPPLRDPTVQKHSSLHQLLPSCIALTRSTALIVLVAAGVVGGAILPSAARREVEV